MLKVTVQEKEDELECSCEMDGNLNDICKPDPQCHPVHL